MTAPKLFQISAKTQLCFMLGLRFGQTQENIVLRLKYDFFVKFGAVSLAWLHVNHKTIKAERKRKEKKKENVVALLNCIWQFG